MFEKFLERHIEKIIDDFNYENMEKNHPDYCPCFNSKPCTKMEDLNCFLCYCPEYDRSNKEGRCKISNPQGKGKWYEHPNLVAGKIWDCSECSYPHEIETVRKYLKKLFQM